MKNRKEYLKKYYQKNKERYRERYKERYENNKSNYLEYLKLNAPLPIVSTLLPIVTLVR